MTFSPVTTAAPAAAARSRSANKADQADQYACMASVAAWLSNGMVWVRPLTDIVRWRLTGPKAWGVAVALFGTSLLIRFGLGGKLEQAAFLTFYPAIALSTL